MLYTIKYNIFIGKNPDKNPIITKKEEYFENREDLDKWILINMLPQSIWWISYQILCDDVLIEEQSNPNLDEDLRSR